MVAQPIMITYYKHTVFLGSLLFVQEFLFAFLFFVPFAYITSYPGFLSHFLSYQIFQQAENYTKIFK